MVPLLAMLLAGQAQAAQFKRLPSTPLPSVKLPAAAVRVDMNAGLALPVLKVALPGATAAGLPMVSFPQQPAASLSGLSQRSASIAEAVAADSSGMAARAGLDTLYFGTRRGRPGPAGASGGRAKVDDVFIVNDEGVSVNGRAAAYYREVRRLVEKFRGQVDLADSLDVMDDTYADVWAKLAAIEGIARTRGIDRQNTHLEETLLWVDGIMKDGLNRNIAVHTHQVFFHHSDNPQSEIAEGIRRVDRYLRDAERHFSKNGRAEKELGKLHEVILAFDTRGYDEIKRHLLSREQALNKRYPGRYRFAFVDELAQIPQGKDAVRAALNALIKKYNGRGLQKIVEGVIYSRYVGVLLELKTIEHYLELGYQVVQSGRDMFDADGHYITELDVVLRHPKSGRLIVVESKSARVPLPLEEALRDKVLYKLDTYQKHRARMESEIGGAFEVVFAFDVGPNEGLREFLKSKERELSEKYGFRVRFLFLSSTPEQGLGGLPASRYGSGWKHLSADSISVLRALREGKSMSGEQIIAATSLTEAALLAALAEIALYPLGTLASTSGPQTVEEVRWTHTVFLDKAAEKVALFLNPDAQALSQDGIKVLRVLERNGPQTGRQLMASTGLDKEAVGRALIELRFGALALIDVETDARKSREGRAVVSLQPSMESFVAALLKYRE